MNKRQNKINKLDDAMKHIWDATGGLIMLESNDKDIQEMIEQLQEIGLKIESKLEKLAK